MTAASMDTARESNLIVRSKRTPVRSIDVIAHISRALWPAKTPVELARRTGVSVRAAEHWLAGRSGLSADALAELLRSDAGFDVLKGLVGDANPPWWRAIKRQHEIAALRRGQEEQRKLLERLEREAAE